MKALVCEYDGIITKINVLFEYYRKRLGRNNDSIVPKHTRRSLNMDNKKRII